MNSSPHEFAQPTSDPRLTPAAQLLTSLRRPGARPAVLPPECAPATDAEAYEIQRATAHALGARIGGWKVALGDNGVGMSAPVYAHDLQRSPASIQSAISARFGIEPEIAFTLAHELAPLPGDRRYTRDQIIDAIGSAHAAIEVVITRFSTIDRLPRLMLLADNICNGGLVVGPACREWRSLPLTSLALRLTLERPEAASEVQQVRGGHPMGDPLLPLLWLANHCSRRGLTLHAGQVVTTGSCAGMHFVGTGAHVEAQFEGLGSAELRTL